MGLGSMLSSFGSRFGGSNGRMSSPLPGARRAAPVAAMGGGSLQSDAGTGAVGPGAPSGTPAGLASGLALARKPEAMGAKPIPMWRTIVGAGLMGIGGDANAGATAMAMRGANQKAVAAAEERKQLYAMADNLGMDPRERLLFAANPEKWAEANKSRYEDRVLSQGQTLMRGGDKPSAAYYAPKSGVDGGVGYVEDETGFTTWGDERPMNHAEGIREETAEMQAAAAVERNRIAAENVDLRHQLGLRQAASRDATVNLARQREGRVAKNAGGRGGKRSGVKLPSGFILD